MAFENLFPDDPVAQQVWNQNYDSSQQAKQDQQGYIDKGAASLTQFGSKAANTIGDTNEYVKNYLNSIMGGNPLYSSAKTSIQSILDNPNPLSETELQGLSSDAKKSSELAAFQAGNQISSLGAGQGLGFTGQTANQMANAYNQANLDLANTINQLYYNNALQGSQNQLQATSLLPGIADSEQNTINNLMGLLSTGSQAQAGAYNNLGQGLANLFGGVQVQPDDFSGILEYVLAKQGQQDQAGFNQQQTDLLQQQLGAQENYQTDYLKFLAAQADQAGAFAELGLLNSLPGGTTVQSPGLNINYLELLGLA